MKAEAWKLRLAPAQWPSCGDSMTKFTPLLFLSYTALFGVLRAQAPADWTRTGDELVTEVKGRKMTRLGQWQSPDGSRTAVVTNMSQAKDPQELANFWGGMMAGTMKAKVLPLKFESSAKPHLTLIFRGQVERGGTESFQDVYLVLTQKGAMTIQVAGPKADLSIDLAKWDLGEPIQDEGGKFTEKVEKLTKDMNGGIAKLQDLVKKGRKIPEQP